LKTYLPPVKAIQEQRKWLLIDAEGKAPGKISAAAARLLQGKHKVDYTPHLDSGDGVIIINAAKIKLSGNKLESKKYYRHSGHLGHLKTETAAQVLNKKPTRVLEAAIAGMLPKNRLRKARLGRLKLYSGSEHGQNAQKPEIFEI
jgi:large subunit ribosomal protein L13